ncbi:hypothetical protein AgCh_025174 [Apium graveolens]
MAYHNGLITRVTKLSYLSKTFSICIFGIIGLNIAHKFLLESDLPVAVVDAAVPFAGATGAGHGYIWMVHKTPGTPKWELATRSRHLWEEFANTVTHQRLDPLHSLGWKKTESVVLKQRVDQLSQAGFKAEFLSSTDLLVNRKYETAGRYKEYYHEPVEGLLRFDVEKVKNPCDIAKTVCFEEPEGSTSIFTRDLGSIEGQPAAGDEPSEPVVEFAVTVTEQVILGPRNGTNGFMVPEMEWKMPRRFSRDSQGRVVVPSMSGSSEVVLLDQRWSDELLKMPPKKATQSKENSSSLAEVPVINEILDLLCQQQQQQLQLIQQIQQQQHQQGELNQTTSFKSFQSVKPPEFKGEVDPVVAKKLAEGNGKGIYPHAREGPVSWRRFTELFLEKYFPDGLRNQLEVEFLELKQGERSVLEYEAKFTELARLIPEYVSTEIQKARRFQQGLRPEIHRRVVALQLKTYSSMVQAALVIESDQKLAVKEESDKKRKSKGVMDKTGQGESSQEFQNRFSRSRSKRFRRQSFSQTKSDTISDASTPAQSVKSAMDCKTCDRRHSGSCKKNV